MSDRWRLTFAHLGRASLAERELRADPLELAAIVAAEVLIIGAAVALAIP